MTCKLTPAEQEAFDRLHTILGRPPSPDEIRAFVADAQAQREPG